MGKPCQQEHHHQKMVATAWPAPPTAQAISGIHRKSLSDETAPIPGEGDVLPQGSPAQLQPSSGQAETMPPTPQSHCGTEGDAPQNTQITINLRANKAHDTGAIRHFYQDLQHARTQCVKLGIVLAQPGAYPQISAMRCFCPRPSDNGSRAWCTGLAAG